MNHYNGMCYFINQIFKNVLMKAQNALISVLLYNGGHLQLFFPPAAAAFWDHFLNEG